MTSRMRVISLVLVTFAVAASPALAQRGGRANRTALLRRQVEQLFMQQARNQLGLSNDQVAKVQQVVGEFAGTRLQLDLTERALTTALRDQLRPGIAANGDSVATLVTALNANRVANAVSFQSEMTALSKVLTPVQLGQFQLLNDRLLERIRELQQQRPAPAAGGGGVMPGMPPPDSGSSTPA